MKETKYKDTEIGKIPEDWEATSIGKFCNVRRRSTRVTKEQLTDEGRVSWISKHQLPYGAILRTTMRMPTPHLSLWVVPLDK